MNFRLDSFFESHFNDLSRFDDDTLRIKESSVIRDKDCPRESVSRQEQMFERSSQRKRSDFEMMKKTFNLDSIEASQMLSRRRDRSSERERREEYRNARDDARNDVEGETNVLMKNIF